MLGSIRRGLDVHSRRKRAAAGSRSALGRSRPASASCAARGGDLVQQLQGPAALARRRGDRGRRGSGHSRRHRRHICARLALPARLRCGGDPLLGGVAVGSRAIARRRQRRGAGRRHDRPVARRCRRRRDGHAGARFRPRQSGDARLPARHAHCRAASRARSSAATRRRARWCAPRLAAPCRARSTSSPAPRAPATSAARSSWARMARDGWPSSFSGTADGVAIGCGSSAGSSSTASRKPPSPWSGCGTDCRRGRSFLRNRPPPQQVRNT